MAGRFVAGETHEEALQVIQILNQKGLGTSLDILGENVTDLAGAQKLTEAYVQLIHLFQSQKVENRGRNVSVKLTMLGLDLSQKFCLENMKKLLQEARSAKAFVRIDMEGSSYTDQTLDVFFELKKEFENVGVVLQAALHRTYEDIQKVLQVGGTLRLCKGAYKEPSTLAYQTKADIRAHYMKCADLLMGDKGYHGFATHDEYLIKNLKELVKKHQRSADSFEFQMLYGMRESAWFQRLSEGFQIRIYVPFGSDWLPYFSRRLRERKENIFFVLSHLFKK